MLSNLSKIYKIKGTLFKRTCVIKPYDELKAEMRVFHKTKKNKSNDQLQEVNCICKRFRLVIWII